MTLCAARRVELGRVGALEAADVARVLDHRALHAEADAEVRHAVLARVADRPGSSPRCRGRRSRPAPGCRRAPRRGRPGPRARCARRRATRRRPPPRWRCRRGQRLVQALVGVLHLDVLADHADAARGAAGALIRRTISSHAVEVGGPAAQAQHPHDALVEPLVVEGERHLVDRVHVAGGDHRVLLDVAEQRDLRLGRRRERVVLVRAAQEHVGLDPDGPQLLDRVLGRLGLELAGRLDERHQREVDVDHVVLAHVLLELARPPRGRAGSRCRRPCRRSRR